MGTGEKLKRTFLVKIFVCDPFVPDEVIPNGFLKADLITLHSSGDTIKAPLSLQTLFELHLIVEFRFYS